MKVLPLTAQEQQWIPQRLVASVPPQFYSWTFRQRTVFALVDGIRSTTTIADMLSTSPETVIRTLRELQNMDVVARGTHGAKQ